MSVKKESRLKLNSDRKLREYRNELAGKTGILFSSDLKAEKEGFPYLKYIVNALILFCCAFGSIYCFITAFKLDMNVLPVIFSCAVSALVFSFMYAGKRAKIIVYLIVLFGIVALGTTFYSVANSGVSAIRNLTLSYIDTHSGLPFLREFNTYFDDNYVSMTVAACVIGIALTLIINIFVSERMSLFGLFLITFPITQFGMYFDYKVSKLGMFLVVSGWVLTAAVKLTNSYNGLTSRMISRSSVKRHRHSYGFVTDSKNVAQIALMWLGVIAVVTGLAFAVVPDEHFELALPTDGIRKSTERVVKNFLSYGLTSMFSLESNSASPGSLSTVANVAYDGMTDLKVQVVNYRADRIYLRQYVGIYYDGEDLKWKSVDSDDEPDYPKLYNYTPDLLKNDYENEGRVSQSEHRMTVRIVDPDLLDDPVAVPYYVSLDGGKYTFTNSGSAFLTDNEERKETQYYTFYTVDTPQESYSFLTGEMEDGKEDEYTAIRDEMLESSEFLYTLQLPDKNIPAVEEFCNTYDINRDDPDVVSKVISALENNFTYTLQPGKIPYGEDYVNYFLRANKKGYCQHFASAATLIFRYLGIHARYAEGYAINREDFYTGKDLMDEDKDEWRKTPYSVSGFVTEIDVPDASGHAWVEIWQDGIGWTVVEATTAPSEDGPVNVFANIFSNNPFSAASRNLIDGVRKMDNEKTKSGIAAFFILILSILLLLYIIRVAFRVIRRHTGFSPKNKRVSLSNRYRHLFEVCALSDGLDTRAMSYEEFFDYLAENHPGIKTPGDICDRFEKAVFSGREIEDDEFNSIVSSLKGGIKELAGNMKFSKKIRYLFIDNLW